MPQFPQEQSKTGEFKRQEDEHINPTGIVPIGPLLDLRAPHGREKLSG